MGQEWMGLGQLQIKFGKLRDTKNANPRVKFLSPGALKKNLDVL